MELLICILKTNSNGKMFDFFVCKIFSFLYPEAVQNSGRHPVHERFGKFSLRAPMKDCVWSLGVLVLLRRA